MLSVVMLIASSDPIFPSLNGTVLSSMLDLFGNRKQIAFDLSVGALSAIGMFYLLVRLPEHERKTRVKRHLISSYESFKRSNIQIFLSTQQTSYNVDLVDKLMEQKQFRNFFKEPYTPGQTKWDRVANELDDFKLRQVVLEAEVLHSEFQYALSIIDISDHEIFSFMKNFSTTLYRAKNWSSDYDGTKEVLSFFWNIFAGWSHAEGYSEHEFVPRMISKL